MPFDASRLLACAIAGGLAASPLTAPPVHFLEMSICGTGMTLHIPVSGRVPGEIPGKSAPGQDCPSACHALASRRCDGEDDTA